MTGDRRLLVCDCAGTMKLDPEALARAAGAGEVRACTQLCMAEAERAKVALEAGETVIACGQEAAFFADLAAELGAADSLLTVDIRDRAGWTEDGAAGPKQAALMAEALLAPPPTPALDVESEGLCLVIGPPERALEAAAMLAPALSVTVLLAENPGDLRPAEDFDLALGRIAAARGAFGSFRLRVDGYATPVKSGRGGLAFTAPRDGARTECDVILDLTGGSPLFSGDHKRDGYLRADPGDPAAVARAALEASQLVGVFEKPVHVRYDAAICAHSRASQPGCDRCLQVCPLGAIAPDGDNVVIDPMVCAGCGACAAVCPSGAVSYDDPPVQHLFARLRTLAAAWRDAGGGVPRLLVHDGEEGAEAISLCARFGRGLPADLVPLEVPSVEGFGHAEALAAFGVGFGEVLILAGRRTDRAALDPQTALARALLEGAGAEGDRLRLVEIADPDELHDLRPEAPRPALAATPILPLGGRRETVRTAMRAIADGALVIALPEGAPYGDAVVDAEACTLCLSCASLCPVGAFTDNPDAPQLKFQEDACLQCGICVAACPEDAITLDPRLNLTDAALALVVKKEEEPFECITCGKPFGVRSTIERIVEKLEGKHWMFRDSDNTKLIQMCDDCRVRAQYHSENNPFAMGERPRVRTTDDYTNGGES